MKLKPIRLLPYLAFALVHFMASLLGFYYVTNAAYLAQVAGLEPPPLLMILQGIVVFLMLPLVYPLLYYFELVRYVDEYFATIVVIFLANSVLVAATAWVIIAMSRRRKKQRIAEGVRR